MSTFSKQPEPFATRESSQKIIEATLSRVAQSSHDFWNYGHGENGLRAIIMTHFEFSVDFVLECINWDFAIAQKKLTFYPDEGAVYPPDCIKILAVGCCTDCCGRLVNEGWDYRNNRLYPCCGDSIRYIFRNLDFTHWASIAKELLVYKLCADVVAEITGDKNNISSRNFMRSFHELITQAQTTKRKRVSR